MTIMLFGTKDDGEHTKPLTLFHFHQRHREPSSFVVNNMIIFTVQDRQNNVYLLTYIGKICRATGDQAALLKLTGLAVLADANGINHGLHALMIFRAAALLIALIVFQRTSGGRQCSLC